MMKVLPLLLAMVTSATAGEPLLQNIEAVRALPHKVAAEELPVKIEGTVIFVDTKHSAIVFHDGKTSCWAGIKSSLPVDIQLGSKVRVAGFTNIKNGYFANIIEASTEVLGQGELPEPIQITDKDLFLSWLDSQWVQIEAIVVGTEEGGLAYTLALDIDGKIFKADVPFQEDASERAADLMQRRVKVTGICATVANDDRQLTDRHFLIPSFDQIKPIDTKLPEAVPSQRKIATLLQSDNSPDKISRITGVVTQHRKSGFYIRDDTASGFVYASKANFYPPGSRVELEGFAGVAPFRPVIRASKVKLIEQGEIPVAIHLDVKHGVDPKLHNELVTTECEFIGMTGATHNNSILKCRSGSVYFEAFLPAPGATVNQLEPGDTVRLKGIYEATTDSPMPRIEWANGFRIHLSGPEAVTILKKAPWWTFNRLLAALGIAIAAILAFLVWTSLLRRQVSAQTKIISSQIERATIKDERQRIARELHDTLEQDLTGLSMQLENALEEIDDENSPARKSLSLVHRMLRHCRIEARASVNDLRDSKLIARPLPETMKESLGAKAKDSGTALDFSVEGSPLTLRSTTQMLFA